jgi:hypothetical protein
MDSRWADTTDEEDEGYVVHEENEDTIEPQEVNQV